ncbi:MAG: CDP-alcohol phosphatidyltransferase family protein [Actinomycetota bacterium]
MELGRRQVLTVPNAISAVRIAMIPVFALLILDRDTTFIGLILFGVVLATDWVDGAVARATGQVSELGKILDPVADRLAIGLGLVALVGREGFPLWAAALVVGRDLAMLVIGAIVLAARSIRIDVRRLGKIATFTLMISIGAVSWGTLGYPFAPAFLVIGWTCFAVGIAESYGAAVLYLGDLRRAW